MGAREIQRLGSAHAGAYAGLHPTRARKEGKQFQALLLLGQQRRDGDMTVCPFSHPIQEVSVHRRGRGDQGLDWAAVRRVGGGNLPAPSF